MHPRDFDASRLTELLRAGGSLTAGSVATVSARAFDSINAANVRLELTYSEDAAGERPTHLFLKVCTDPAFDASEVHYYTRDYAGRTDLPLVRCYAGEVSETPPGYFVLLEDLTATHRIAAQRELDVAGAETIARGLARLHAAAWGPDRLEALGYEIPGEQYAATLRDVRTAEFCHLLVEASAEDARTLSAAWERRQEEAGGLWAEPERVVLLHGDLNPTNVLVGRDDPSLPVYFLDRQPFADSIRAGIGALDLAYALCPFWPEGTYQAVITPALGAYRSELATHGIEITPADLRHDFARGLRHTLLTPAGWFAEEDGWREEMRWLWTRQAANLATALRSVDALEIE